MFRPNNTCVIMLASGRTDVYGQPIPGESVSEGCSIVRITRTNEKSPVRADSSASRGNAREIIADAIFLLTPSTQANLDDIIVINGTDQYRIIMRHPQYNVVGVLNHYRISAMTWN